MKRAIRIATAAVAFTISCRSIVQFEYDLEPVPTATGDHVAITYLGVSGFVIEYRGKTILTGSSFTNPSLDSVTPTKYRFFRGRAPEIKSDTALIERLLPASADNASMIVVGHGHYDHLLDVPYIATHRARNAVIYGSPTVKHMLMGDPALHGRVVSIDSVNRWITSRDGAFRIMALTADHAPTIRLFNWGHRFADGTVDHDLDHLPRRAEDWKLGEPFSYIIDVLAPGDTAPVYRIYFQDAPNTAPLGFPPRNLGGRAFDLAILCVATAKNVDPVSPDSLLRVLKPRHVIAAHWESFFRPQTLPLVVNPASDVDAFIASLNRNLPIGSRWNLPLPRTTLRFATGR
jgi:L-ascorbate metabolism protein UlaG (beta-lactamase superfamily)